MALTLTRSCPASIDIAAPDRRRPGCGLRYHAHRRVGVEGRCASDSQARPPRPGARFRGRNRGKATLWTRTHEVLAVDPPKLRLPDAADTASRGLR
jgi:hypothetical protein